MDPGVAAAIRKKETPLLQEEIDFTREMQEAREAAFWDQVCSRPATLEDVRLYATFPSTRQFLRALGDCRGKTILDLGCGAGLLSVNLARALQPRRILGIDIAPETIAKAKALARLCDPDGICEFEVSSAYSLPLADESVDIVVGVAILHHLDKEDIGRELVRVLRRGGEVHLAENNGDNPLLCAVRTMLNRFDWFRRESEDGHPLTRDEIDQFARHFAQVEVTIPYVELFRTLAYGRRPLSRFEPGLALMDRALRNPLTRSFSMARWVRATKGA
jgi:ubiquinone/menaquinone biosynthesis C-methylase UbiE